MPYCVNCGSEVTGVQSVCLNCGVSTTKPTFDIVDRGGIGWGLLGFFVPIAGLVLYLIWIDTKPLTAKAAGIGALCYLGVFVVLFILYFILIGAMFISYA